jgi:8-oxo-dGTP pyrophosphatase MutT (NUDIX family)
MRDRTLCLLIRGNPPDEVLLGYKKNGFGAGKFTGIGGKVEENETIISAAVRELEEETGIKAREQDLHYKGCLTFLFPFTPAWSQVVYVFLITKWDGEPVESTEIKPVWFQVDQLPVSQMWQDASHWMPLILSGESIRMRFVFDNDNETVREVYKE